MMRLIRLAVLAAWFLLGCTNPDGAKRALTSSGFTHVELTGPDWFGCAEGETADGFKALNPRGLYVTGVVCCGAWGIKGCTVRF